MSKDLKIDVEDLIKIDGIFVEFKKESLSEIRDLVISKFQSISKFSKLVNVSQSFLSQILNNQARINLKLAVMIAKLLGIEFKNTVYKFTTKISKSFILAEDLPIKGSPPLASLVGQAFGDGNIWKDFSFTNKCKELMNEIEQNARKIGIKNLKPSFYVDPIDKTTRIKFPKLVREVLVLAGAPKGNKVKTQFKIPKWIKFGSKSIKRNFLRALFDSEGSVKIKSREITLKFAKIDTLQDNLVNFLEEIGELLQEFSVKDVSIGDDIIQEGKNGLTIQKVLRICGLKNFDNFLKNIGFTNPTKKIVLRNMIENTQRIKLRAYEGMAMILSNFSGSKVKTDEIAQFLGISKMAAWKQLSKLKKEGLVKDFKSKNNKFNRNIWLINDDKDNTNNFWERWRRQNHANSKPCLCFS